MNISSSQIAAAFEELATLMDLKGENVFKVKAHQNAARILENLQDDLPTFLEQARQGKVRGVGEAIYQKIELLVQEGRLAELEALRASFPPGVLEMLRVPGLGPKKVRVLYQDLGITSLLELETACRDGKIAVQKGFGEKTQNKILEGLERLKNYAEQFLFSQADTIAQSLLESLKSSNLCTQILVTLRGFSLGLHRYRLKIS